MKEVRRLLGLEVLIMTLSVGCVGNFGAQIHSEAVTTQVSSDIERASEPTERDEGIIVHIDPTTGEIITPPTGVLTQPPVTARQPLPELTPTPSPVPGGGVMIHLDDRFQTPLTATIDADGKVRFEHKRTGSGSDEKK